MRLDKYLKDMRIIKRRTVANTLCDAGKVLVNDVVKKASYEVAVGDKIMIQYGNNNIVYDVIEIPYEKKKK